jgi:hypothetical protein
VIRVRLKRARAVTRSSDGVEAVALGDLMPDRPRSATTPLSRRR